MTNDISSPNQWARVPGTLAWAPLPLAVMTKLKLDIPPTDKNAHGDGGTSRNTNGYSYYWPVILYPSWSNAAKQSGLIDISTFTNDNNNNYNDDERNKKASTTKNKKKMIHFIGCKTGVTVDQMKKNLVPKRVALGCSSVKGQALRPKVVAYFLGLVHHNHHQTNDSTTSISIRGSSDDTRSCCPPWSAVNANEVEPYNLNTCKAQFQSVYSQLMKTMLEEGLSDQTSYSNKVESSLLWQHLILAMEEASIVSEQNQLHPKHFIQLLRISKNNSNKGQSLKTPPTKRVRLDPPTQDSKQTIKSNIPHKKENDNIKESKNRRPSQEIEINREDNYKTANASISKTNDNDNATAQALSCRDELTPECFSDWRVGGNTQKLSESSSQSQFVLTAGTVI